MGGSVPQTVAISQVAHEAHHDAARRVLCLIQLLPHRVQGAIHVVCAGWVPCFPDGGRTGGWDPKMRDADTRITEDVKLLAEGFTTFYGAATYTVRPIAPPSHGCMRRTTVRAQVAASDVPLVLTSGDDGSVLLSEGLLGVRIPVHERPLHLLRLREHSRARTAPHSPCATSRKRLSVRAHGDGLLLADTYLLRGAAAVAQASKVQPLLGRMKWGLFTDLEGAKAKFRTAQTRRVPHSPTLTHAPTHARTLLHCWGLGTVGCAGLPTEPCGGCVTVVVVCVAGCWSIQRRSPR